MKMGIVGWRFGRLEAEGGIGRVRVDGDWLTADFEALSSAKNNNQGALK